MVDDPVADIGELNLSPGDLETVPVRVVEKSGGKRPSRAASEPDVTPEVSKPNAPRPMTYARLHQVSSAAPPRQMSNQTYS